MNNIAFKILKLIVRKREISLGELSKSLPKKNKDHRDYYILSSLITGGYIDMVCKVNDKYDINQSKNMELAITLYTMTLGKGKFEYQNLKGVNGADFNSEKLFCTSKADFYIEELKQKRNERVIALAIGVLVGIITSLSSVFIQNHFNKSDTNSSTAHTSIHSLKD
jgi:hypothetical protein